MYKIREEIAWRKMKDGTTTIVSPLTDKIITINGSASVIWEMLDGNNSIENIADKILTTYEIDDENPSESVFNDVEEIVASFIERDLIEKLF